MVLGQGLVPVAAGLLLGLGGAVSLSRALRGLLYGVSPADPPTYAAIVLGVGTLALFASYLPARRAARLHPARVLRAE